MSKSVWKRRGKRRIRGWERGAALAEGVAAIALVITITIAALGLLTNSGMSMYYKQKLAFVSTQTAMYAATRTDVTELECKQIAEGVAMASGLSSKALDVKLEDTNVSGKPAIKLTVVAKNLPLLATVDYLPGFISLKDSATALKQKKVDAYMWLNRNPRMSGYLIPIMTMPAGGVNSLGLPYVTP